MDRTARKAGAGAARPAWVGIETPILLRAIAIVMVIMSYTPQFFGLRAFPVLFMVSGLTFAKFMRPTIRESGDAGAVWRMILKFGIPAGIWVGASFLRDGGFWWPDIVLLGTFFQNPADPHPTFWFLDVLAANLVILALIAKTRFHLRARRGASPLPARSFVADLAVTALAVAAAYGQVLTGWWDGEVGVTSVAPFKYIWMMALGMVVFSADTPRRRLAATAVFGLIGAAKLSGIPEIAAPFYAINGFFFLAGLALIWRSRLRVPRWLQRPLTTVAASTLFIYIAGHHVVAEFMPGIGFVHWPVSVAAAVAVGIVTRIVWDRITHLVMPLVRRVLGRTRGVAQGGGAPL